MSRGTLKFIAWALLIEILLLAAMLSCGATAATQTPGCELRFEGVVRAPVKNRAPRTPDYPFVNEGRPLSVPEWFAFVCSLDPHAPLRRADVPQNVAMDIEAYRVKVRAFLLAVRREPDNDLHLQIGQTAAWKQEQIVAEIPPGQPFCEARTALVNLMTADGWNGRSQDHVFRRPPRADVTGYLFLDSGHMPANAPRQNWCVRNGERGIKNGLSKSPVRGLWEIHPVLKIEAAP